MFGKDIKDLQSPDAGCFNTGKSRQECGRNTRYISSSDGSNLVPFQARSGHQHPMHGHTLPSDTYLRQALTSPYNQRSEKVSAANLSPYDGKSREAGVAYNPSLWRERVGQIHGSPQQDKEKGSLTDGIRMWTGEPSPGADVFNVFRTPKRAIFNTPNKGRREKVVSSNSSPSSSLSGSGSSSSGHHMPHVNPFEHGHDRLHFPVFSPGMFDVPQTPGSAEKETFQWNLEHIAELRPVHIDDKEIKRQMSRKSPDEEVEQRAQKAIDYYFQHHMVAPSPWSEAPPPHVLPVTPAYSQGYGYEGLMAATPDQAQGSIQKDLSRNRRAVNKSCQTTLTLPLDFDLEKVLGDYLTYQETDKDDTIGSHSMGSSSLRRRLFLHADTSSILSPARSGHTSPDHLSAALCTPPKPNKSTPEWERESPLHTPSSIQFSSSPIRGSVRTEGEYLRSSFSEYGPLASPELSPIADKDRAHRLSSSHHAMSIDVEEEGLRFGSQVRKQLQMEVHDGNSPRGLPSPNMSPIADFKSGGSGHHSKSHTLRAEMSQSVFASPQHPSSSQQSHIRFSPSPEPFSTFAQSSNPRQASVCMETDVDFLPLAGKGAGLSSPCNISMTDVMLGEGGNSLDHDTLQNPSSMSNPDMGYQTGSGSGSLQTTQEVGFPVTTNSSTDNPPSHLDTSIQLKRQNTKLHPYFNEHSFSTQGRKGEAKVVLIDESSVDGMGSSVDAGMLVHTNLTNQFMNMPLNSEHSADSVDLNNSDPELKGASVDGQSFKGLLKPSEEKRTDKNDEAGNLLSESKGFLPSVAENVDVADSPTEIVLECGVMPKLDICQNNEPSFIKENGILSAHVKHLYDQDADFLKKIGEFLERGEASDDSDEKGIVKNNPIASAPSSSTRVGDSSHRAADDSVIERARQYLKSVNYSEKELRAETVYKSTADEVLMPPPKSVELSTPSTRLLGRVVEDLTGGREKHCSPALGSEVAKEILRRAQLDLKRIDRTSRKMDNS